MRKGAKSTGVKPLMKRRVKDSVFSYLFKDEQYRYQLYKFLHPEDKMVQPKDIAANTLEPVLVDDLYNDLCLRVNDRVMIFVEDQSTFGQNLAFGIFLYAASTYREFALKQKIDTYHGAYVFPKAEFYVIYTGNQKVPRVIKLSDSIEGIELKVKVLKGKRSSSNDIVLSQRDFDTKSQCDFATLFQRDFVTLFQCDFVTFSPGILQQKANGILIQKAKSFVKIKTFKGSRCLKNKRTSLGPRGTRSNSQAV